MTGSQLFKAVQDYIALREDTIVKRVSQAVLATVQQSGDEARLAAIEARLDENDVKTQVHHDNIIAILGRFHAAFPNPQPGPLKPGEMAQDATNAMMNVQRR